MRVNTIPMSKIWTGRELANAGLSAKTGFSLKLDATVGVVSE